MRFGLDALKVAGIQKEFSATVNSLAHALGISISFRAPSYQNEPKVRPAENTPKKKQKKSGAGILNRVKKLLTTRRGSRAYQEIENEPEAYKEIAPQHYSRPYATKAGDKKTKSCNWGPVRGYLPGDILWTRFDKKTGKTIGFHEKDAHRLETGEIQTGQAKEKLQSILYRTGPDRDYTLISFDKNSAELVFECNPGKKPDDFHGRFVAKLSHSRLPRTIEARPWEKLQEDTDTLDRGKMPETEFLALKKYIDDNRMLERDMDTPVFYQMPDSDEKKPVTVMLDDNGLPITGDWDMLWVAPIMGMDPILSQKVLNTFDDTKEGGNDHSRRMELYTCAEKLYQVLRLPLQDAFKGFELPAYFSDLIQDADAINRAGCITPFEFMAGQLMNYIYNFHPEFSEEMSEDLKDIMAFIKQIQHGAENRNPYKPESLEGNILHFLNGMSLMTESEAELIALTLSGHYLHHYPIEINGGWDLDAGWGHVLAKKQRNHTLTPTESILFDAWLEKHQGKLPPLPGDVFEAMMHYHDELLALTELPFLDERQDQLSRLAIAQNESRRASLGSRESGYASENEGPAHDKELTSRYWDVMERKSSISKPAQKQQVQHKPKNIPG